MGNTLQPPPANSLTSPAERRRLSRIPFRATSVVTEAGSSQMVVAQTSELSRFGCFVQTAKPYPQGSRVHIEMSDGGDVFTASAVVAYVTPEGMGVVFSMVEPEKYEVLARWLSRTPRRSDRYAFVATAMVRDLESRDEQVLITRDLGAGGCFVKTSGPLPKGSRIRVRIAHAGAEFTAVAKVTDNVSAQGMGIEFVEIRANDRAVLQKWLAGETPVNDISTKRIVIGLLLLVGAAIIAAVVLMVSYFLGGAGAPDKLTAAAKSTFPMTDQSHEYTAAQRFIAELGGRSGVEISRRGL